VESSVDEKATLSSILGISEVDDAVVVEVIALFVEVMAIFL
jgi:hypothetical protein